MQKVARLASDALPVLSSTFTVARVREALNSAATETAVIVDDGLKYLGQVAQTELAGRSDDEVLATFEFDADETFDQTTSIWEAMQTMRDYIGEAIPVVDTQSGRYLGAVPESAVINAYLDAAHELRREEHEA